MTIGEFVQIAGAKKVGRNQYIALCPAHPDRTPSLSISVGKKRDFVFKCMSQNCPPGDILRGLGLTWASIMGPMDDEAKKRAKEVARIDRLKLYWGAAMLNKVQATSANDRAYWAAACRRMEEEIYWAEFKPRHWVQFRDSGEWVLVK